MYKKNLLGPIVIGSFCWVGDKVPSFDAHPNTYLSVELTEKCSLNCEHCIYHRSSENREFDKTRLVDRLREYFEDDETQAVVSFSGREPTEEPDFLYETAEQIRPFSSYSILMTNGLQLNQKLRHRLSGVIDCVDLSIDGERNTHDRIRGAGTFDKTWQILRDCVKEEEYKIGIIATATNDTWRGIAPLARHLKETFGTTNQQIGLSISIFFGHPGDAHHLKLDDLKTLLQDLRNTEYPTRILLTANCAHLYADICEWYDLTERDIVWDHNSGLPVIHYDSLIFVLFNYGETDKLIFRISSDGYVYLSCNHLSIDGRTKQWAIGDLKTERLREIETRIRSGRHPLMQKLVLSSPLCESQPCYNLCGGGDLLSGIYFTGASRDPFCHRIN